MERYLPTGSELLSLPRVNEKNGAVEDLGFLHMGSRGLIELRGGEAEPLMRPFVELDGAEAGCRTLNGSASASGTRALRRARAG